MVNNESETVGYKKLALVSCDIIYQGVTVFNFKRGWNLNSTITYSKAQILSSLLNLFNCTIVIQ